MFRPIGHTCLAATLLVSSCARTGETEPLRVVAVLPNSAQERPGMGTLERPVPLYLNSNVTVSFSADVDPLSVTDDTVRILRVTPAGPERVRMARRRVGTRSVILEPEWPLSPALDDGSFQPGQLYKLEVAGFPLTNTVYSKTGVPVGDQFFRYYKTVERDVSDPGPLLPVGLPSEPFQPVVYRLRMASDLRTVLLHFTLPVDPASVSPRSFTFRATEPIPIESTRVLTMRRPWYLPRASGAGQQLQWSYPASTVELKLAPGYELSPSELFGVDLKPAGREQSWIRDLRGRPITSANTLPSGKISKGEKIHLLEFDANSGFEFVPGSEEELSFECRGGRMQVLARRDAGSGRLGVLRPKRSMVLQPRVPCDFGDGRVRESGSSFEFSHIHIPKGVTVTVRPEAGRALESTPVELLSTGSIRIDGELVLETVNAALPGPFESRTDPDYLNRVVVEKFGCRLVAAADIEVHGAIRHLLSGEESPPPLVLLGRRVSLYGPVPPGSIRAQEPGLVSRGTLQTEFAVALSGKLSREPGWASDRTTAAAAWTPWRRLPADFAGRRISARAEGVVDAVDVFLQVAAPDPIDPARPYLDSAALAKPRKLPLKQPLEISDRVHVRFLLRARLIGGRERLPSVQRLVILGG